MFKNTDSEEYRLSRFKSWFCHLITMILNKIAYALCTYFIFCKMKIIVFTLQVVEKVK